MGNRTPTPPREVREKLEQTHKLRRDMRLNKIYFTTLEGLAAKVALSNLKGTTKGQVALGNTRGVLEALVRASKTGGTFDDVSVDEMVSNKGVLVKALDSQYGEPPGGPLFPDEVIDERNEIKERPFFTKRDPNYGRGRLTWPDLAIQHRAKQVIRKWATERKDNEKPPFDELVEEVIALQFKDQQPKKEDRQKVVDAVFKEFESHGWDSSSYLELMHNVGEGESPVLDEEDADERTEKLFGKGFGLGDDDDIVAEYFVKTVRHGKNANIRIPNNLASNLFEILRVPMIGGVSGTTVDFIGGLKSQSTLMAAEETSGKGVVESVIAVFMFSMVGAGHHSLVEMICAAKQWGYFTNIPDPFSDIMAALGRGDGETEVTTYDACLKAFERHITGLGLDTGGTLAWGLDQGSDPRDQAPPRIRL